jgi:hypothetical protein
MMANAKIHAAATETTREVRDWRWIVAKNPATPPGQLAALARSAYVRPRRAVAGNPSTPPEVLAALAKDGDAMVRARVADNPHTPPEALSRLALQEDAEHGINVAEEDDSLHM